MDGDLSFKIFVGMFVVAIVAFVVLIFLAIYGAMTSPSMEDINIYCSRQEYDRAFVVNEGWFNYSVYCARKMEYPK